MYGSAVSDSQLTNCGVFCKSWISSLIRRLASAKIAVPRIPNKRIIPIRVISPRGSFRRLQRFTQKETAGESRRESKNARINGHT